MAKLKGPYGIPEYHSTDPSIGLDVIEQDIQYMKTTYPWLKRLGPLWYNPSTCRPPSEIPKYRATSDMMMRSSEPKSGDNIRITAAKHPQFRFRGKIQPQPPAKKNPYRSPDGGTTKW